MPVVSLEINSRQPLAQGAAFGGAGSYQQLDGRVHFAVDPNVPANSAITDIHLAPRDQQGRVTFSADFRIIQPVDPSLGNRKIFYEVVNRGNPTALRQFNDAGDGLDPTVSMEPGNGFLMRMGYTLAWCGWQHDVPHLPGRLTIDVPEARDAGGPVSGNIGVTFQPNATTQVKEVSDRLHRPYPANNLEDWNSVLTVREDDSSPAVVIPRDQWSFGRLEAGRFVPDASHIYLAQGFQAGKIYQVIYSTSTAPVVGLGLLATKDLVSFLRYQSADDGNPCAGGPHAGGPAAGGIDRAYAFGRSQSGRFLRVFLYHALNQDEQRRTVFDCLLTMVAGGRRGEFNYRFGQPSPHSSHSVNNLFPFTDVEQTDPETGATGGLLSKMAGQGDLPKIFFINTSAEYWGGHAALIHTDVGGAKDITPYDSVRIYHFAGTQHGPGVLPLRDTEGDSKTVHGFNTVDYRPLLRAALTNMDRWVSQGEAPPDSRHPRIGDGTAVTQESVGKTFQTIPGAHLISPLPHNSRLDFGPVEGIFGLLPPKVGKPYPNLVSAVDADGNELGGIRLPDLSVPLATHAGWNVRHPDMGGAGQFIKQIGSTIPFSATEKERQAAKDPRISIEERYPSREDYLAQVSRAAQDLVDQGYLLAEDLAAVTQHAAQRYDLFAKGGLSTPALEAAPAGDG